MLEMIKKMRLKIGLIFTAFFLILNPIIAFANPTYEDFHSLHPYIVRQGLIGDVWRWMTWGIISGLRWLIDGIETAVFSLLTMGNHFFRSTFLGDLMQMLNVVVLLAVPIVVMVIGFRVLSQGAQGMDYFKKTLKNVVFTVIIVVGSNFLFTTAHDLMSAGVNYVTNEDFSLTDDLISSSIIDINHAYRFGAGFNPENLSHRNNLTSFEIDRLNYTQRADRDIFDYEVEITADGPVFTELHNGRFPIIGTINMFIEHNYRFYLISPFTIMIQLVVIAFALTYSGIKFAKLSFDMAFKRLIATFVAIFDLHSGAKFKMLLGDIGNTFLMMFFVVLCFVLYINFALWLNSTDFPIFVNLLLLVGGSLGLIDGPKVVEKITGHDAGISSDAMRTMYFMSRMANSAGRGIKATGKGAKNFAGGINEGARSSESDNFEKGKDDSQSKKTWEAPKADQVSEKGQTAGQEGSQPDQPSDHYESGRRDNQVDSQGMSFENRNVQESSKTTQDQDRDLNPRLNPSDSSQAQADITSTTTYEDGEPAPKIEQDDKVHNQASAQKEVSYEDSNNQASSKSNHKQFGDQRSLLYKAGKLAGAVGASVFTENEVEKLMDAWQEGPNSSNQEKQEKEEMMFSTKPSKPDIEVTKTGKGITSYEKPKKGEPKLEKGESQKDSSSLSSSKRELSESEKWAQKMKDSEEDFLREHFGNARDE